jgi:hypothetical protein
MSSNPHSVVHSRQYSDVEKTKEEQPRKSEPGVKGMVSGDGSFAIGSFSVRRARSRVCLLRMIIPVVSFVSFLFLVYCPSLFDIDWLGRIGECSYPMSTMVRRFTTAPRQNRLLHIVASQTYTALYL